MGGPLGDKKGYKEGYSGKMSSIDERISLGYWIRRRRKALDLTQAKLAQQVGCAVATIKKIEADERRPSPLMAERLAECLGIPAAERAAFLQVARAEVALHRLATSLPLDSHNAVSAEPEKRLFVARQPEIAQLDTFLNQALTGRGRVAFVVGEAGSGKTALVQEVARRAQEMHPRLIIAGGNCNAYSGIGDPYLPFREILALLTGDVETRSVVGVISQAQARRLAELVPHAIQTLVEAGPDLIELFISGKTLLARAVGAAALAPDRVAGLKARLARQAAEQSAGALKQQNLFAQYIQVLQALSRRWPLLLLLDDLQWADAGSISLLFHLGRQLTGQRILVVGIYRPNDVALGREGGRHPLESVVNEFQADFGQIQVDLAQAGEKQFIEALLDSEPNRLGAAFRHALWRQTSGHALFTVEMLRGLQERGDLVQDEQGRWVEGAALDWETLPARVEGVIGERLGRLPADLQAALQVACVEGEVFTAEVVAQIEQIERRELVRRLSSEVSKQHRLVQEQGSQQLGTQRLSTYRFHHILFQKYLYNLLDQVERVYLHEAVGQTLETLHRDQPEAMAAIAGQLAYHFQAAGLVRKAVDYLTLAGEQAVRVVAYPEASSHFTQALAQLATLPETTERVKHELALLLSLGAVLTAVKGYTDHQVAHTYSQMRGILPKLGQDPQIFPALMALERFYANGGEFRLQYEVAAQVLQLAQAAQDPMLLVGGHQVMGTALCFNGQFVASRAHLEQSLALYDPQVEYTFNLPDDPGVIAGSFLGWTLWRLGFADQAVLRFQAALRLAQGLANRPYREAVVLSFMAMLHQWRRDAPAARQAAEACMGLATKHGFSFLEALARVVYGWALAEQGELAAGIEQMQHGVAAIRTMNIVLFLAPLLAMLAECYGKTEQVEEGLTLVAEAIEMADRSFYWMESDLYLLRGALQLQQVNGEEAAEASLQRAIALARGQEANLLELRATVHLARLWRTQGKSQEAQQMLAELYGWFSEGFDTVDLREAKALLAQGDLPM